MTSNVTVSVTSSSTGSGVVTVAVSGAINSVVRYTTTLVNAMSVLVVKTGVRTVTIVPGTVTFDVTKLTVDVVSKKVLVVVWTVWVVVNWNVEKEKKMTVRERVNVADASNVTVISVVASSLHVTVDSKMAVVKPLVMVLVI